jgi:pimeloyl-ACP methyl ester carboxylesterase
MAKVRSSLTWQERIGHQREWSWRGWQLRYSFQFPSEAISPDRPPLILLHGFGAAIEHWRQNIPVLSQYSPVYALDLLGFGGSRKADTDYSVYLWANQVYDFWRTFINRPVVLVGNSIGSLVCLTAAQAYPEMVAGIVMLSLPDVSLRQDAIPPRLQPWLTKIENLFAAPWLLKGLFNILRRPGVIQRWAGVAYSQPGFVQEELVQIICRPPQDSGAAQAFCCLSAAVRQPHFAPAAKQVLPLLDMPILLIWGLDDRMVPPILAKVFAPLNPRLQLLEWEGVGHCPQDECPDRFNQALTDWLQTQFG